MPDAVDFRVFSVFNRVSHTYTVQTLLKGR